MLSQQHLVSFYKVLLCGALRSKVGGGNRQDIIVDADLGLLGRFGNEKIAQQVLGRGIKGLLK
jgi:hypothetical protein